LDIVAGASTTVENSVPVLSELYVSYGDVIVNVPNEIISQIVNPKVGSLRLSYCGTAKWVATDVNTGQVTGESAERDGPGKSDSAIGGFRSLT